ncbi:MAG: hypothetical protein JWM88_2218 [Verrucomicrobia bacterium]|nr:hypothetical protein [Verrucomicrobiota bacterium]
MKTFRLVALGAFLITLGSRIAHAQEGGQQQPDEIITDFGIDEFIYTPKFTLSLGMRSLTGSKTNFTGRGAVLSVAALADTTTPGLTRYYHDGTVFTDTRLITDSDGNTTPITPDGYTNSWSYNFAEQVTPDGNMAFHTYSADIRDPGARNQKADSSSGIEVVVARDMGAITKKLDWKLFVGLSLNDINSARSENLSATITTTTDFYSLNGQTPPPPPYLGPTSSVTSVVGADGSVISVPTDSSTLLGSQPLGRLTTVTTGTVLNRWKVKGAYFTLRAGPSLSYAITEKLKATLSLGAALVFVGSTYTVDQIYSPDVGDDIDSKVDNTTEKLLPGYYADATLEYAFTERAGAYAGAIFQSNGSYEQRIATTEANYSTKIDLASLQGFRLGMNFRF